MKYKLYNVDCLEFMRSLPDKSFDAVITDPPYGISASKMRMGSGADLRHGDWDKPLEKSGIDLILSKAPISIIWGGNYYAHYLPPSRSWLAWDKNNPNLSFAEFEMAWTNIDTVARMHKFYAPGMDGRKVHVTQKPKQIMRWCIEIAKLPKGATIFDPFMGSGTTGVACMELGFNFIGCEIDPDYFSIAERRIKQAAAQEVMFT